MSRKLTASVLFAVAVVALTAAGQPPQPTPKAPEKKVPEKKAADPVDALIAAALVHDADVRMAQAKVQLAEAELAKARQQVALKVTGLHAAILEHRRAIAAAEERVAWAARMVEKGVTPQADLLAARDKLDAAKAQLARAETELQLLTGSGKGAAGAAGWNDLGAVHRNATWGGACVACHATSPLAPGAAVDPAVQSGVAWFLRQQAADGIHHSASAHALAALLAAGRPEPVKGPVADRIRAALDKPIRLGPKDAKVTFEQAVELFKKEAGLDVPVRAEFKVGPVVSLGEELPVGAWLQLYADGTPNIRILVREYGLLVTGKEVAPPDGVSVFDFWKQKPTVKVGALPQITGRFRGTAFQIATAADDPLARAAVALTFTNPQIDLPEHKPKEWDAALARDHLRVLIANPTEFGLGWDQPGELLIDLSKYPESYEVLVVAGPAKGTFSRYHQQGAPTFKAFTEAVRKVLPVK